jgi:hypothetical protein
VLEGLNQADQFAFISIQVDMACDNLLTKKGDGSTALMQYSVHP